MYAHAESLIEFGIIDFSVRWIDPSPMGNQTPKSPPEPPIVSIEGHLLTFKDNHPEYEFQLIDDNNNIYSFIVPGNITIFTLPNSFQGNYSLQLIMGNWLFYGLITL